MFLPETIHPNALIRVLRGVDGLPRGASGALAFTAFGSHQGTILVEDRRVCWAVASDMEHRLTGLLRAQQEVPLSRDDFEEVYQECHRRQMPLGETLVARGLVSRDGLRTALRQHTAEAIGRLAAAAPLNLTWKSNGSKRYDAEFTFSASELLCCIGALGLEFEAEQADRTLREVTPDRSVGVAFLTGRGHSLPVAQISAESWRCQSLLDLGAWAREALGNGDGIEGSVLDSDTVNSLKRAWRSEETLYVRFTGDREPPAQLPADAFDLERETLIPR